MARPQPHLTWAGQRPAFLLSSSLHLEKKVNLENYPYVKGLRDLGMPPWFEERAAHFCDIVNGVQPPPHLTGKRGAAEAIQRAIGENVEQVVYLPFDESRLAPSVAEVGRTSFLCSAGLLAGPSLWLANDALHKKLAGNLSPVTQFMVLTLIDAHLIDRWQQSLVARLPYLRPCLHRHVTMLRPIDGDGHAITDHAALCATRNFRVIAMDYAFSLIRNKAEEAEPLEHLLALHLVRPLIARMDDQPENVLAFE